MDTDIIPFRTPSLPTFSHIMPYLKAIDDNGWYSNYGPLYQQFIERLAKQFRADPTEIICLSNATAALSLTLKALSLQTGTLCMVPSFTFSATPTAAVSAGLIPWFIDIDPCTWSLSPEAVKSQLILATLPVSAVIVVSPYGAPIDIAAWENFQHETNIPVIVDAAWCFDTTTPSIIPQIISLHATKSFGIGEGGMVICKQSEWIEKIHSLSNFGLNAERESVYVGDNRKLSEYAAAIGLAALDLWPSLRSKSCDVARAYYTRLRQHPDIHLPDFLNGTIALGTFPIALTKPVAEALSDSLRAQHIHTRAPWWGKPCHVQKAFRRYPCAALTHTESISKKMLNLPFSAELSTVHIDRVAACIKTWLVKNKTVS